ncbi:hypothetical protein Hanom_Chr08g00711701 [Helianthus anomalus]
MNIWSYLFIFSSIFPPLPLLNETREHVFFFVFSSLFPPLPLLRPWGMGREFGRGLG